MVRKEWILLVGSVTITLLVALGLIRWFAPQLLGLPADLQLVRVAESLPPFYEGVFRREDYQAQEFLLKDPLTRVRAKPLLPEMGGTGPHDILGFRNPSVPNVADIVIIGDSQTYGNNAVLEENWPSQLRDSLGDKQPVVYNMSVGGWGAVQYLDMFANATVFRPRVVIVAFYTGNDPLDSFQMAYGVDHWQALRPNENLNQTDGPHVTFPAPEAEWWLVEFGDGVSTIFTPTLRLSSNQEHPAVEAGYAIMAEAAKRIGDMAKPLPVQLVFTIVPTKELVFALKVQKENLTPPADYLTLIERERENIRELGEALSKLPNAIYVDLVSPLQEAALDPVALYPTDINGHPVAAGYRVIARTLSAAVDDYLPAKPEGLVALQVGADQYRLLLVNDEGVWPFASTKIIAANGWSLGEVPIVQVRDVAGLPMHADVATVDPRRFGPESIGDL